MNGEDLPESVRMGQRLTGMSANQATLAAGRLDLQVRPARASRAPGSASSCRTRPSIADELCFVRSLYTEAINHDPAITFFQTGSQIAGRPSMGAWLSYGLGSTNENLPAFCVLISQRPVDQPLYSRLWGNGFLPSVHQGVQFRAGAGAGPLPRRTRRRLRAGRRKMLDRLRELHQIGVRGRARPGDQTRGSPSTRWPTACRRRCPK